VRLPPLVIIVLVFTVVAFYGGGKVLGYNISGISWVVPMAVALLVLVRNLNRVTFPFVFWLPWALLLLTYLTIVDYRFIESRVVPVQRTLQLLSPVIVGMAVSTFRTTPLHLAAFSRVIRLLSLVLLGIALFKAGLLLTGRLPYFTPLAPEVMTVMLLCTFFATRYFIRRDKRDLIFWGVLACVPVIAVTRTAIAATLLTFPLSFGPMRKSYRIGALLLIAAVGLGLFYSPRMQQRMFYSGEGELSDIFNEDFATESILSSDFATSSRSFMWERMYESAQEKQWTGHGTGAGETFAYQITESIAYPHNDWLLTYFDYGVLGVAVFTGCMLLTMWDCLRKVRTCRHPGTRQLLLTGASAFIPFMLMMVTDNIMVYASFFGNLHFTFLGLAHGALRAEKHVY
jgi:hypothetical protein